LLAGEDGLPKTRLHERSALRYPYHPAAIVNYYCWVCDRYSKSIATIGGSDLVAPAFA
jgi:hypothetical protein